jgi:carboxyl-terminal processing protease
LLLQSDVKEFAPYRATLVQAIHKDGDTSAAHAIFSRYLQRLAQRAAYVGDLIRTMKFDFTGHDAYTFNRENAERPRNLEEAREIWRQQICAEYLQEKLADKAPDQIGSALMSRKSHQLAAMKALRHDEVLEIYLSALAHVYDPHTDYLGHEQMESLTIAMNLSLVGIGASLETADGHCKIHEILPGGPALRSGQLKPGDRIVAVAQSGADPVDIRDMPLSHVVELIRGPKGTTVKLTVLPAGAANGSLPKNVSLVRDEIKLEEQQAKARIFDLPNGQDRNLRLGVIDLPSFYADMAEPQGAEPRNASADVARLLTKLKSENVCGVALDLRSNTGGSLGEAIKLAGLFIRQGPVVQIRGPEGKIEVGSDRDSTIQYDGPLVVLTSRFSASASEILAGALQDYGRALVVGDSSTFGKGTVQSILPLAPVMDAASFRHVYDPGALKLTISKFYRPNGASMQLRGVSSDIVLPSPSDIGDVNESAMKNPLPWDAVPAVPIEQLNRVQPYLNTLRERALHRVNTEKEFAYLAEDVAWLKKSVAEKLVSLNEAERRQDLAQLKARQSDRKQRERDLSKFRPMVYEITLKNAASPGLPAQDDRDQVTGQSPDSDVILHETVRILADYVDLLGRQTIHHTRRSAASRHAAHAATAVGSDRWAQWHVSHQAPFMQ